MNWHFAVNKLFKIMPVLSAAIFCQLVTQIEGEDTTLTDLYRSLFYDYNKEIRPVIHHNHPVNTNISFSLVQVVDVDERNQLLTSLAWIHFKWNDWRLAWDPRLNGQITKLNVPTEMIWTPDIILYNNAASEYLKEMTTASVTYDGNISLSMAGIFKSSCELDVRFYPFDFQSCLMKFASWAYDGTKIDIFSGPRGDQSNYMISTEWTLREVRAEKNSIIYSCCPEPYPFIDIYLLLERKPLFFVIFSCLPCVLISLLVLLGFYMPSDSGEKVTLGITSLLSTTVFLMLVSEHLPPTADALPLIGIYYGVTIFIVSLQTAFTVFTLNIHYIGTNGPPVPRLLQMLLFGRFSRLMLLKLEPEYHSINEHVHYFSQKQVQLDQERKSRGEFELSSFDLQRIRAVNEANNRMAGVTANDGNNKVGAQVSISIIGEDSPPVRPHNPAKKRVSFPDDHRYQNGAPPNVGGVARPISRKRIMSMVTTAICEQQNHKSGKVAAANEEEESDVDQHNKHSNNNENERGGFSSRTSLLSSPERKAGGGDRSFESEFIRVLGRLQEVIERNELRLIEKDRRNAEKLEWQQVALVLDRFFLVLFTIGTLVLLFCTVLGDRAVF